MPIWSPRSAMVILVACIFITPAARPSHIPESAPKTVIQVHSIGEPKSLIGGLPLSRPCPSTSLATFTPWRHRLKTVLEETDPRIIEESDLGPAIPPSQLIPFLPFELVSARHLITPPLRC